MRPPVRRVVLLGFMASGKTTVGAALAERLGWSHLDLDREIEREQGARVEQLFEALGEAGFRGLEAEITPRLGGRTEVILTPGGGWITQPELLAALPTGTFSVWLRVSAAEVFRRLRADPDPVVRPLLRVPDPESRVRELLRSREPLYERADVSIDTDGRSIPDIVDELETLVRKHL